MLLVVGGYLGGALTFVYGVRVLKHPNVAIADALIPGRTKEPVQTDTGGD